MGLFCSVIHLYQCSQEEVIRQVTNKWKQNFGISKIRQLDYDDKEFEAVLSGMDRTSQTIDYLITKPHGNWITISELNLEKCFLLRGSTD